MLFNECLNAAVGKARITSDMVFEAETRYSVNRLRALADEWSSDYPNLIELILFLKGFPRSFRLPEVTDRIAYCMLQFLCSEVPHGHIYSLTLEKFNTEDIEGFVQEMFKILFRVGAVGVRQSRGTGISWSYQRTKLLGSLIDDQALVYLHPAFHSVLGIDT